MKKLFAILLLAIAPSVFGQTLYAVTSTKKLYRIYQASATVYLSTISSFDPVGDIAVSPSGILYGIADDKILQIDPETGSATPIATLPPGNYVSLVCSNDYELYSVNSNTQDLYKYDIQTGITQNVAHLGIATSGDLVFYNGNLIIPRLNGLVVKAYNLELQTLSDIICTPPFFEIYGLMAPNGNCQDPNYTGAIFNGTNSLLYDFDIITGEMSLLNFQLSEPVLIYGLASSEDHLRSVCPQQILEPVTCNPLSTDNFEKAISVYPVPTKDKLYLKGLDGITNADVFDIAGQLVRSFSAEAITAIDVSDLQTGVYVVKVTANKRTETVKMIKE